MLSLLIFFILCGFIFGMMMLMLKPCAKEGEVERRLRTLLAPSSQKASEDVATKLLEAQQPGSFDWIEDRLQGTPALLWIRRLLLQSQSSWRAGDVVAASIALALFTPLIACVFTSKIILLLPWALWGALPSTLLYRKRARRLAAFEAVLPATVEMCARSLRAGHSIAAAIGVVAEEAAEPARTEFGEVFRKQNYGLPQREALMEMLERVPSRDLRVLVTGILVQKDTGGNLPEIMDRIVAVIRDRVRIQGEVRTHTAQGRLTGWILCLLPPALLLLINLMNPGYSRVLLENPVGQKFLYAGVVLLLAGAWTIRNIVRGIEV